MALFKTFKGLSSNLMSNRQYAIEGYAYFTTDDGKFYIDIAGDTQSETPAVIGVNRIPLNAEYVDKIPYALCTQDFLVSNKTVTTTDPFTLKNGSLIIVKFSVPGENGNPGGTTDVNNAITLNVNNTGAIPIYYRSKRIPNEYIVQNKLYLFRVNTYQNSETGNNEFRYDLVGDVVPELGKNETVITTPEGEMTSRPFVDSYRIVNTLPTGDNIDTNVVYLVPTGESSGGGASGGGSSINLPDQTNNSGKFLTTDGTDISWGAVTPTSIGALPDTTDVTKWNDVTLTKTTPSNPTSVLVPFLTSTDATTANLIPASTYANAYQLAKYNSSGYLISTTPSASDNSTKVATTAYVDNEINNLAIPTRYNSSTNTGGYLTMADLPIYNGSGGII